MVNRPVKECLKEESIYFSLCYQGLKGKKILRKLAFVLKITKNNNIGTGLEYVSATGGVEMHTVYINVCIFLQWTLTSKFGSVFSIFTELIV
jgi:hypothetical protein